MKKTVSLGKIAYASERKVNEVTITVELEEKDTCAPHLDVNGVECRKYIELSMQGEIWNSRRTDLEAGGQCLEEIAKRFPENRPLQRLVEIWRYWHLNGLRAGCAHQMAEKWNERPIDPTKPTNVYGNFAGHSSSWNMLVWVSPKEHPEGLLGKPCPTCGYKYGTAWLVDPLPVEIEKEVMVLLTKLLTEKAPC